MKRAELLERLELYKKEIYRRAYILLLAALLPAVVIFIGIGLEFRIIQYGIIVTIGYFAAFLLVMIVLIWWFVYMINKELPKKIGLFCPKCNAPVIKNNVEEFMKTGECSFCGEKILED